MKTIARLILIIMLAVPAYILWPTTQPKQGTSVTIRVEGRVDERLVVPAYRIRMQAENIKHLIIHINTRGGSVNAGMELITAMRKVQKHGGKVSCYVKGDAMSMGFVILSACDNRYATPDSTLLTHWGSISCQFCSFTTKEIQSMATSSYIWEAELEDSIRSTFKVSDATWDYLNTIEAFMSPREANSHSPGFVQCNSRRSMHKIISCKESVPEVGDGA